MKKVVLNLDLNDDDKAKQKAMKMVSSLLGIDSIAIDMKEKKLTVVGEMDLLSLVNKLRKSWHTDILTVGPAKEPEKKKDDENKKEDEKTKDDEKKKEEQIGELVKFYKGGYNPNMAPCYYYYVQSYEENPNACAIC